MGLRVLLGLGIVIRSASTQTEAQCHHPFPRVTPTQCSAHSEAEASGEEPHTALHPMTAILSRSLRRLQGQGDRRRDRETDGGTGRQTEGQTDTHVHVHLVPLPTRAHTSRNMSPVSPVCPTSSSGEGGRDAKPPWHPAVYHHCGCVGAESLTCCDGVAMAGGKGTSLLLGGVLTQVDGCHGDNLVEHPDSLI